MQASSQRRNTRPSSGRQSKPKWHLVYYLLAVFDVLTVATSLSLNRHLMNSYEQSVQVNQAWSERLQSYSELAQRAGAVNAPGNDVFDSRDIEFETDRLQLGVDRFQEQMAVTRQELEANVEPIYEQELLQRLDEIDVAMAEMLKETNSIFSYLGEDQTQQAAQRMASMDRAYAGVNLTLETLRQRVGEIQQQNLEQQKEQASLLKIYEYAVTGAGLLMVTSLTLYGHKLSKKMAADVETKGKLIEKLQQNNELKQTLEELHRTQSQMVHSEKMAALGQMVAGVAHEINNPLNFIHSNLNPIEQYLQDLLILINSYQKHYPEPPETLQAEIEEADLEFLQEDITKLMKSMNVGSHRIREIVNSLRNFSRLDEASYKAVDIHEGLDNTLMILQHRLKASTARPEIRVIKEFGQLPLVECYAGQLNQVFMNLLANAIDALETSNEGQNYQDIEANPNTIWIHTQKKDEQWIVISIADNGSGMTETVCSKLFDPFFTTKVVGKGTGLGLSISYQIVVEKHGGKIWCDSTPGEGSKFVIEIPVGQPTLST